MNDPLDKFELTEEQKFAIIDNFNKNPNLMSIVKIVFKDDTLDGRSVQGRAVRTFLSQKNQNYKTSLFEKADFIEFSEQQKEFMMTDNVEAGMNALEVAKLVFKDSKVQSLSLKHRAVVEFLNKYRPDVIDERNALATDKWMPPKAISRALKKINDFTGSEWEELTFPTKIKRNCEKLLIFLRSPRFLSFINQYVMEADRELFESEFVRAVWDKPDLTNDELNSYITLCMNYVRQKHIQLRLDKLNAICNDQETQQDLTMRMIEIIKTTSEELNQCEKRIESLTKDLNGSRQNRLKTQGEQTSNILALVQAFQDAEERGRMMLMADRESKLMEEEADRLESMDEFKSRILGISKRELL